VLLLYPEDVDCYGKAKTVWLNHLRAHATNTRLLGNAAAFFEFKDPLLSEEFLTAASSLEPSNAHWRERLGQHFALKSIRDPSAQLKNAANALQELKAADEVRLGTALPADPQKNAEKSERDIVLNTLSRIHALPRLAKAAFDAGQVEEARRYAADALEAAQSEKLPAAYRDNGDAIHQGNLLLGRCALAKGEIEQAKQYLIASGKTKGSAILASVGPSMTLAKELLERGETDAVLEYFQLCTSFWHHPDSPLDQWSDEVKRGQVPEFIPFLMY
jgi:tetratricopeptide (TPR) repeat protein